jgi:cobalamin biosynthesis protein CbiG
MKDAAAAGTSVFDAIATGNTQDAQDVKNVKDVNKKGVELARLNLKIPAELKEYLTIATAKASIKQRRNISLTQYLCELIRADMEKHKDQ